ncbi:chemotaxis protein CheX [Acanthopleuribacter pedis]|uniref:Chemotaxis protein CheX n=1 Tax=Acanthopleuribacter pedis TaxID=442870 RepID=A0A8J7U7T5_9BACT|nr:chemotaxis protein CheX [Acanthopleuribacter pedis]MBO1323339.1 chemotaxis protein CheX [Acanthopleuribacter pedis]
MKFSVEEPEKIQIYLEIAAFSQVPCVFYPTDSSRSFEGILEKVDADRFGLVFKQWIPAQTGLLVIRSFTLQFKCQLDMEKGERPKEYTFPPPQALSSHDPRKYLRIPIAPQLTKIVVVKKLNEQGEPFSEGPDKKLIQGAIQDVSANGIAFKIANPDPFFVPGGQVHLTYKLFGLDVDGPARVVSDGGSLVRCQLSGMKPALQHQLNQKITVSFQRMLEKHHRDLLQLIEASAHLRDIERTKKSTGELADRKQLDENFVGLINPILDAAVNVMEQMAGLKLVKREIRLERICSAIYDLSSQISFQGPQVDGHLFLCLKQNVACSMAGTILGGEYSDIDENVRDMAGELCNIIIGNAKKNLARDQVYKLSTPTLIVGKEHLVAVLSKYPVVRIIFDSPIGQIDLNLYLDEINEKLRTESLTPAGFEYKTELINPILRATENIFENFLFLETRKKGVVMRETLAPKFELSGILDVFGKGMHGKILLNLSNKLALQIHEILLGVEKDTIDDEVKDAVGEMVNIITGNAKGEFERMNLGYNVSTPYVIYGRNHIISNAGDNPFISSVYWSSKGFFEVCLSFTADE